MNDLIYPINLNKFKEIDSTNDYLKKAKNPANWTVILTDHQTKGRGQTGQWLSEKGTNLSFSIYITPNQLKAIDFFLLNKLICNAIHMVLFSFNKNLYIKWPNDILLEGKKIAGILIENTIKEKHIKSSIMGIGINVNQMNLSLLPSNASSLKKITNIHFNLDELFLELIKTIQKCYKLLEENKPDTIRDYYLKNLYKKGEKCAFSYNKTIIKATIESVDQNGCLLLKFEKESTLRKFNQKEINLIY